MADVTKDKAEKEGTGGLLRGMLIILVSLSRYESPGRRPVACLNHRIAAADHESLRW